MIVKMSKYTLVLMTDGRDQLISTLRPLGLVDITARAWEPQAEDRRLIQKIEERKKALAAMEKFLSSDSYTASAPEVEGDLYDSWSTLQSGLHEKQTELTQLSAVIETWKSWGDFSPEKIQKLQQQGVQLRFFCVRENVYAEHSAEWAQTVDLVEVGRAEGSVLAVAVCTGAQGQLPIEGQELKLPEQSVQQARGEYSQLEKQIAEIQFKLSSLAKRSQELSKEITSLSMQLRERHITQSAETAADGKLTILEGWAPKAESKKVDQCLDAMAGVYYIKEDPKPEDDTPVKLQNNRFARVFELIGSMYALPKYGTVDLTPFFAPFYMLFFAICLNDAGYGAVIMAAGIAILLKGGEKMRQAGWLSTLCGLMTVIFGTYSASLFGMNLATLLGYESIAQSPFLDFQGQFFSIALAIGIIQIMLGMAINVVFTAYTFGFKYCLGALGWLMLILAGCLSAGLPMLNEEWVIPFFTTSSPAFYAMAGVGIALMLFLNSPDKNIFANFGAGLWNTYNNLTGILSDVLSYIRLFAIGLSGGVLALVFNQLALGLTGLDAGIEGQPIVVVVLKIVGASAILLIGHGINLFMSAISSFVHPMRLTFVEFFKNAGFEMGLRAYEPLKEKEE